MPISSAVRQTAAFSSAHPLVNRLVENTIWSQRSNFIDVPTDCPQRDERLGWTGDAQVFAATACYLHESHGILRKFVRDMMADQRPDGAIAHVVPDPTRNHEDKVPGFYGSTGWGDAICVIPLVALRSLRRPSRSSDEALPAMVEVESTSSGRSATVRSSGRRKQWGARGFTFGDWLQPPAANGREKPLPTIGDDAAATIYLYISSTLTARAARIVGDEARREAAWSERAETVQCRLRREFITPSGRLVYDDQTSYALAILHDLIPDDLLSRGGRNTSRPRSPAPTAASAPASSARRRSCRHSSRSARSSSPQSVFLQEEVPGWLYQVKTGATTIWERWDAIEEDGKAFDPQMNSYNHYAYGAVCQWLFESVAGFRPDPDKPGFQHIIFEPVILPALSPVAASHDSVAGRIEAGWSVDGDRVTYDVVVPDGASGTLLLSPAVHRHRRRRCAARRMRAATTKRAACSRPERTQVTFRISKA